MFFRGGRRPTKTQNKTIANRDSNDNDDDDDEECQQPVMGKDGKLYVEEGQEYDADEYETDSDYSHESEDDEEETEEIEAEDLLTMKEEEKEEDVIVVVAAKGSKQEVTIKVDVKDDDDDDDDGNEVSEEEEEVPWPESSMEEESSSGDEGTDSGDEGTESDSDSHSDVSEDEDRIEEEMEEEEFAAEVQKRNLEQVTIIDSSATEESMETVDIENSNERDDKYGDHDIPLNGHSKNQQTKNNGVKEEEHEHDANDTMKLNYDAVESSQHAKVEHPHVEHPHPHPQQKQSATLCEKRSILALAAQHDRVDIIKTVVQSSSSHPLQTANLVQLLLNNKIPKLSSTSSVSLSLLSEEHKENVFLPPLHIAIASSSTNAASCLLRMGADPSIRPSIPEDWDGPLWDDPTNSNNVSPSISSSSGGGGGRSSRRRGETKEDSAQFWKQLQGLSAWEVAFGANIEVLAKRNAANIDQDEKKNGDAKKSWFGWSSSNQSNGTTDVPNFNIVSTKLEGIKHAFTAEALRAIGSDEVSRLRELINSGMDSTKNGSSVEIGGKPLIGWCTEMNAERCSAMLKELYSLNEKNIISSTKSLHCKTDQDKKMIQNKSIISEPKASLEELNEEEVSEFNLHSLEIKLEESRVLAKSLSLVLDNLADEVSLTQGLMYQQGDKSNSALLSQVRLLKETRSDTEMDISEWEGLLADRIVELRMVLTLWNSRSGSENTFSDIFDNTVELNDQKMVPSTSVEASNENDNGNQSLRINILEKKAQVTMSESKVKKLRSSIADLAEENARNLVEVTKLGLSGAVHLARKLKEEVKEREHILQNLKERETVCRTRIFMIRSQLEKLSSEAPTAREQEAATTQEVATTQEAYHVNDEEQNTDTHHVVTDGDGDEHDLSNEIYYDEEEDCFLEYIDNSDESDLEYEYYTDSNDEEEMEEDTIPLSEAIKTGKSTALVLREDPHVFFSFKLWELLMRIIGLSKKAIKETAQTEFDNLGNLPRAMIV